VTLLSEDLIPRLGLPELDDEHTTITRRLNRAYAALGSQDRTAAQAALSAFLDEILEHFAAEEMTMEAFAYPAAANHMVAHHMFIQAVRDLIAAAPDAGFADLQRQMNSRIVPEFLGHMRSQDASLRDFLALRANDSYASKAAKP